jgi:WD40-like Beta Propeller Repeat
MRLFQAMFALWLCGAMTDSVCRGADPEGSLITFLSHRTGRNLLYRMRSDGSEVTPIFGGELKDVPGLTEGLTLYREPHWTRLSPDRRFYLSWATDLGSPLEKYRSPAHFMIYLGRLTGGQTRVIAPDGQECFAWSPNSRRLAYAIQSVKRLHLPPGIAGKLPGTEIVLVGVDGSEEEVILERLATGKSRTGHLTAGNCSFSSRQPSA